MNLTRRLLTVGGLVAWMTVGAAGAALAAQAPDPLPTGDISGALTVTKKSLDDGSPIPGSINVSQVVSGPAGPIDVTTADGWDNLGLVTPELIGSSLVVLDLPTVVDTNAEGVATFDSLAPGLYWVSDTSAPPQAQSFLVTIPMADPITGEWLYSIEAFPSPIDEATTGDDPPELYTTGDPLTNPLTMGEIAAMVLGAGLIIAGYTVLKPARARN
jgi:hypothetical protein